MPRYFFGRNLLLTFMLSWLFPQLAWAGSGDSNSTNSNSNSVNNSETTAGSTYVPQQTGIVQFNNSSSSTLTYPNCGGVCAFGIMRFTPSGNGTVNPEAVIGVVAQFDSPEIKSAQAQRDLYKAQLTRTTQEGELLLLTKLADAIENCQDARANIFALSAAKSLGMTPEQLLSRAYKQPRKCDSRSNERSAP